MILNYFERHLNAPKIIESHANALPGTESMSPADT